MKQIITLPITFMAAPTATGAADTTPMRSGDVVSHAIGIATQYIDNKPSILLCIVAGDVQSSVTLCDQKADTFCHMLAAAVEWQNDELRARQPERAN